MVSLNASLATTALGAQPLIETAQRRKLLAELKLIESEMLECGMNDSLTQEIKKWHTQFCKALHASKNEALVLQTFITQLQFLLVDPIAQAPLDTKAVIGSDGHTYSSQSLSLYLNTVPEPYKYRSPLNPENLQPFTTKPHRLAQFMVNWIMKHPRSNDREVVEMYKRQEELDRLLKELSARQVVVKLPTEKSERMRLIIERQRQAERKQEIGSFQSAFGELESKLKAEIQDSFNVIQNRMSATFEKAKADLQDIQQVSKDQLKSIHARQQHLEIEIKEQIEQVEKMRRELGDLGHQIDEARREESNLGLLIEEARLAIKERQKAKIKSLITTVAIIGACVFATWALPQLLGANVGALPVSGGAKLAIAIPF